MGNARILVLLGMCIGGLVACRDDPSRHAEVTAAPTGSHDAGMASRWIAQGPSRKALDALLAGHAKGAAEQGLKPVLYVGASWCQPCKLLSKLRHDPRVVNALRGTYMIEVDFDHWGIGALSAAGYQLQAVPVFFEIGADGKAAGPRLDGDAWTHADAEHLAAAFEGFFHQP